MTKGQALHAFFSGFGMSAYAASAVPDDVVLPYLTYELVTSAWEGGEVAIAVNLWFHTESEAKPNAKVNEISEAIGLGGVQIRCDGGAIWLKRGSPWCQSLGDAASKDIKRRYLNITAEYLTIN